ncbi:carbohydrate ABC transporter permease [Acidipropionibacterium acidipropionici]|jgi:multiple sugar transport system permease protein|uniref:Sugar ABC transporter permease n=2 Tax=Acidipropionibacterium acidipropionici TaxID=1748 RepID=A0AAC9AN63_9ACTN|nr:carbohydrate ABC transporter permease [Acidipropionibacterium acidipropionici]AFV90337.1 Sugar ABC superfamily ATP binding cassette transporter, membrane protein [Acidipropionibacterium acidipropionici ATCC 4875]AMS05079.1 sugar ABC transporter permease [Acidipropionibacterium acidipropionici]AOZ46559.1 sugar ABC transporter permease [Acidipropionibacterium acidipropionici]AZP37387.1 carbohydrate ABC transporter permease [Acidipropionibacterium acidipropionici]
MSTAATELSAPATTRISARAAERAVRKEENRIKRRLMLGDSKAPRVVVFAILLVMSVAWLIPILWAIDTSLKTEPDAEASASWIPRHGFTLSAYVDQFASGHIGRWMLNSLGIALAVMVITVIVSAMAAYAFSCTRFRGRNGLFAVTIAAIMVPSQILIVPQFQQMQTLHLVDTAAAVVFPQVVQPVMILVLKSFMDQLPRELLDAARIDGASAWRVFWSVVMPLSRSIISAVAIFVFIGAWNNFLWPFIITNNPSLMTLPVGLSTIKNAYGVQYVSGMASAMIASIPLLVIFMLFQRKIVASVAMTGMATT